MTLYFAKRKYEKAQLNTLVQYTFCKNFFRQNTILRKMLQMKSRENKLIIFTFILRLLLHARLLFSFNTRLKLISVLVLH